MPSDILKKSAFRKGIIIGVIVLAWEIYARILGNSLLLPPATEVAKALFTGIASGVLLVKIWTSISILLIGFVVGVLIATILASFASSTELGRDLLSVLTSIFNPLPAIALLPLALLWFGLGTGSIVFIIIHAVVWTMAVNMHYGFNSVNNSLRMAGQNIGLKGVRLVWFVLIPAAFPSIFSGLKVSWAFAWRTLIAAELIFGVSTGSGGIGWFIYESRNTLDTANVFAGLLAIVFVGVLVEEILFNFVEKSTIRKWGVSK